MRRTTFFVLAALTVAACATDEPDETSDTGEPAATTLADATTTSTGPPAASTTDRPPTTTTTEPPPATTEAPPTTLLSRVPEGYKVSDDYVVETVDDGIDQATGGIAVDDDGAVYASDFGYSDHPGQTITRIEPDGTRSIFVSDETMTSLTGSTFGPDGTLYQSGFGTSRVYAIAPDGAVTVVTDRIAGPTGIVASPDGRLFVESCTDDIIFEVLDDGSVVELAQDPLFACLNGLTQGDDGTLYAVNFQSGRLFEVTLDGEVTTLHEFPGANAHVLFKDDQLFVTSRTRHVVWRYDLTTGVADIVVGIGAEGHVDGPGPVAQIERPNAIALGPDGTIYINHGTDRRNHPTVIRAIRPA